MSSFKRKESVTAGSRRLVCAELESAIQALSRETKRDNAAQAVQALDRGRAALELAGNALPRDILRRDRKRFNAIGKTLRQARLCQRLSTRLDKLVRKAGLDTADPALKKLRKQLAEHTPSKVALRTRGQRFDPMVYRLVAELAELRGHVGLWPEAETDPPEPPPPGLSACYRAARNAARKAEQDPGQLAAAHPPVALLCDALTLVGKCCPAMIKPQRVILSAAAKPLHDHVTNAQLIEAAGQDKSLTDLTAMLQEAAAPDYADAEASLAKARQFALAETPQAFLNRIGAYWSAWRASA
ncbi:MAG: hypothetical protein ACIAXF_14115 [Phycisphaerales bacterium JB063]